MNYTLGDTIMYLDKINVQFPNPKDPKNPNTILKDVSFVERDVIREGVKATGQTIAFLGRSGRGKSTLFKVLTGLLKPTSGRALLMDMNSKIKDAAKEIREGDVGFVDQKYTLFRHKTITEIFKYALRKENINDSYKKDIIQKYLVEWGLEEHKDKYSCELSGGQRQRTAIIEQLLTSKHFMVFDEPFSGLDVGNIEKAKTSFDKILSDNELNTIIFSTHDIKLAVELADSIYIIGHPEGVTDYSTIIKHIDLKEMGIAWTEYGDKHREVFKEIKETLLAS